MMLIRMSDDGGGAGAYAYEEITVILCFMY